MRRLALAFALVAITAAGCDDPPPTKVPALGARIELAAGDVWLVEDGDKQRLITGAMLPELADLEVGAGGRALVRLGSGAAIFLRGGTRASLSEEELDLAAGEVWAEVPADEGELTRLTAGKTTVSAAGAGIDLAVDGDEVRVYAARGLALVASPGGRTEVGSGERAIVKADGAPDVQPVEFWEDWTGGMADRELSAGAGGRASGRIYGIDRARPGSAPQALQITSQEVRAYIRDGVAHTTVDQRFFNPSSTPLEGWYWFTVPEGASVERFAMEVNGVLVDGEMIERKTAAAAYEEAVRRAFDPALLEWVDGRTFRARIYPVPATGERRVVLSYTELLPLADGVYRYVYPMGGGSGERIQEFSLSVNLGDDGEDYAIATLQDARVEEDRTSVSMRRSGFVPRSDFLLELRPRERVDALRAVRFASGKNEADYVMLRYSPEVGWDEVQEVPGDVVVVLDTSAGGDDSERQIRVDAVEAILRALSDGDHFAVVTADLTPRVIYPEKGLAAAGDEQISAAMEQLAEVHSAGATDLGLMFNAALELVHEAEQPAVVYVGDGRPTVGEIAAVELSERLRRSLGDSRARLFTLAVGAEANHALLERLARVGGGRMFRIDRPEQTVQEALRFAGMVKTPTITDLQVDAGAGLDQLFSTAAGKISEGEEVVLLARTHHDLPGSVKITGRLGGEAFEKSYSLDVDKDAKHGYVPSLWARAYLDRLMGEGLEENRGTIISLGLGYALMTPFTSFLVLENESAYLQQGIRRRDRSLWGGLEDGSGDAWASAGEAAAIPLMLFGCSEMSPPEDRASDVSAEQSIAETLERIAQLKSSASEAPPIEESEPMAAPAAPMPATGAVDEPQGGKGRRHRGEEGQMGKRDMARSSGRYGMRGPADNKAGGLSDDPLADLSLNGEAKREVAKAKPRASSSSKSGVLGTLGGDGSGELADLLGGLGTVGRGGGGGSGSGYGRGGLGTALGKDQDDLSEARARNLLEHAKIAVGNPYAETATQGKPLFKTGICSDASNASLSHRRILWQRRLARAADPATHIRIFTEAGERCELPRWRDRKVLLDLIEARARNPQQVPQLLSSFRRYPSAARYLRRRIVRRALDPDLTMGLYFPSGVNWRAVRRGLAALKTPEQRLEELREILAKHPDDPSGRSLLVETLLDAEQEDEARAEALRLKRDGLAGPAVLRILCDLQAAAGDADEARRTCSELVEFNADDPRARQALGDLFLRHGWYDAAYRQYRTLVDLLDTGPEGLLRLAAAAAGMGKVDEALRIERQVSSGDGEPGAGDPRRWARLHSAVRLARMIIEAGGEGDKAKALTRSLKRTQAFTAPTTLMLVVWEDLQAPLSLVARRGDDPYPVSDRVDSPRTGLVMIDVGSAPPEDLELLVGLGGGELRRAVPFQLFTISWDGRRYDIAKRELELAPRTTEQSLGEPA